MAQLNATVSDLQIASEDLIVLLERSGTTLAAVARRLEDEFADRFSDVGVSWPAGGPCFFWARGGSIKSTTPAHACLLLHSSHFGPNSARRRATLTPPPPPGQPPVHHEAHQADGEVRA
jgi:hypothetical protein